MCKTKLTTRLSSWKEEEMTTSLDRESRSKELTIMGVKQEKDTMEMTTTMVERDKESRTKEMSIKEMR
jgi:hypothetical protein